MAGIAVRKLREAATTHKLKNIAAHAAFAAGRFTLHAGDADAAAPELERAAELFTAANLPHEAARARLSLAQALAGKHAELAANEAKTAATAFERLGAKRDASAAGELLRTLGRG